METARTVKSPEAFRTISEVADELDVPQHVLRFWESKFSQIKPLKRGGGRRYYRPDDVELLRGIRQLLYTEGYTIKGVQKVLRENGARTIASAARDERVGQIAREPLGVLGVPSEVQPEAEPDAGHASAQAGPTVVNAPLPDNVVPHIRPAPRMQAAAAATRTPVTRQAVPSTVESGLRLLRDELVAVRAILVGRT